MFQQKYQLVIDSIDFVSNEKVEQMMKQTVWSIKTWLEL